MGNRNIETYPVYTSCLYTPQEEKERKEKKRRKKEKKVVVESFRVTR